MPRSQFQDTFTKTDSDKNLQYDDSAFFFFSASVLWIAAFFLLVSVIKQFFNKRKVNAQTTTTCKCNRCKTKISELGRYRKHATSFYVKIFVLSAVVYIALLSTTKAAENKGFKSFDPWEIMGLEPGTAADQIKRKYKQLALKFHPDRNKDDDAVQKLILLNKAYSCLTNPDAAANCGNYGNPDGNSGTFEVGIALPSFLLKKKNRLVILALFFIIILIVIPLLTLYLYQNSDNKDKNNISFSLHAIALEFFKNDSILFKNFIELLSVVEELGPYLRVGPAQVRDLERLAAVDPTFVPKFGTARFKQYLKPFYLIRAYMNDGKIPESCKEDFVEMLKVLCRAIDTLFDLSFELYGNRYAAKMYLGKPLSFNIVDRLITFSQHFYQGLWLHDSPLMQLPSFRQAVMDIVKRKLKKTETIAALRQGEGAAVTLEKSFGKDPDFDVKQDLFALQSISDLEISWSVTVAHPDGVENEVWVGDMYTLKIVIKRLNPQVGFIHSNSFPLLKRESVLLMLVDGPSKQLLTYKRFTNNDTEMVFEIKEIADQAYVFDWQIHARSDSYIGVDVEKELKFAVLPKRRPKSEMFQLHPDDEKALREQSFMKSLLDEANGKKEDSDNELEEPEKIEEKPEEEAAEEEEIPLDKPTRYHN